MVCLTVRTPALEIAYEAHGPQEGIPAILLHGFPYDPRCYDEMVPILVQAGCRVIAPYLRGYGPTRFLDDATMRSGQQAALAKDLLDLMDGLGIARAGLVGYDWGGRAACIVAALWPDRVSALVTGNGYNIQNIPQSATPASAEAEHRHWYQYYFHTPRGEAGLAANRRDICRLLWRLWSPSWDVTPAMFDATAVSFDNPDFVALVIHSYRHRFGYAKGDPTLDAIERDLEAQPPIGVPTVALWGGDDGLNVPRQSDTDAARFTGPSQRIILQGIGHNIPQ